MKVTLIIPTLNEIGGMKIIMPRIKREWVDQILFIDGRSTDGTIEYARENGYSIVIQKKYGLRNAYVEALEQTIPFTRPFFSNIELKALKSDFSI